MTREFERDMLENTWFIIGADHGDYTGEKGIFNKSESPPFEIEDSINTG